tara:strand:- start:330 stop:434 length:105 start_codon:yes stop_codon:yes gene_type:complete
MGRPLAGEAEDLVDVVREVKRLEAAARREAEHVG